MEFDGWCNEFDLGLLFFRLPAKLSLNVPGRAVMEVVLAVSSLYVLRAAPLFIPNLLAEVLDLFFILPALDSEPTALKYYVPAT